MMPKTEIDYHVYVTCLWMRQKVFLTNWVIQPLSDPPKSIKGMFLIWCIVVFLFSNIPPWSATDILQMRSDRLAFTKINQDGNTLFIYHYIGGCQIIMGQSVRVQMFDSRLESSHKWTMTDRSNFILNKSFQVVRVYVQNRSNEVLANNLATVIPEYVLVRILPEQL